jgi:hypothetical protein
MKALIIPVLVIASLAGFFTSIVIENYWLTGLSVIALLVLSIRWMFFGTFANEKAGGDNNPAGYGSHFGR